MITILFRDLYGKSESSQNTEQKSYVSREFQGRCYRVFHMFKNIDEIEKKLKNLKSVTVFREAMPFFDNEKYKIDREDLYQMLTSDKDTKAILQEVKRLLKPLNMMIIQLLKLFSTMDFLIKRNIHLRMEKSKKYMMVIQKILLNTITRTAILLQKQSQINVN